MSFQIAKATTPEDFDAVRGLCWDYRDYLLGLGGHYSKIVRHFYPRDGYAETLRQLETTYSAPDGCTMLARLDGAPVGCGMLYRLYPDSAEIKRVYLRPEARGKGMGWALMEALISQARSDGYARILMDTGDLQKEAKALYLRMGFRLREAYQETPKIAEGHLSFFEMDL